jgi:3-oxoacyl-[acyl-carrier-protein] synthase II
LKNKIKVVVTAVNACSSLGTDITQIWHKLKRGISGIKPISRINVDHNFTKVGAQMDDNYQKLLDLSNKDSLSKCAELSLLCAQGLLEQSNLNKLTDSYHEIGLVLGSGLGGLYFSDDSLKKIYDLPVKRIHPFTVPFVDPNSIVSAISRRWRMYGHQLTISTACSSGANAIGTSLDLIRSGRLNCVITGGVEYTFSPLIFSGFDQLRAMSRSNQSPEISCKPFSQDRDGFVMGEGAAMLMLESEQHALARGATILAELSGYGVTGGGHHIVKPVEDGSDGYKAMIMALKDANITPEQIDLISPHGTGTRLNDQAEYAAMANLFTDKLAKIPVVPLKQLTGHMLGASGAFEAVHLVKCIEEQIVTPIIHYKPEQDQRLNISTTESYAKSIGSAISNSFGFGNNNVSLVFNKYVN